MEMSIDATEAILEKKQASWCTEQFDVLATSTTLLVQLFGCWHRNVSRPFTTEGETYRVCLNCGARRRFDLEGWRVRGPYYYGQTEDAMGRMHRH